MKTSVQSPFRVLGLFLSVSTAILTSATTAHAQTTWTGNASGLWSGTGNWNTGLVPTGSNNVLFDSTATGNFTNAMGGANQAALGITFDSATPYTVRLYSSTSTTTTNRTLTLGASGITVSSGNHTILGDKPGSGTAGNLILPSQTFHINSGSTLTFDTRLRESSASSYTKNGTGTLVLNANNGGGSSWSIGTFTLSQGILQFAATNAFGTSSNKYVVANGAALELTGGISQSISAGNGTITINGTGISGNGALRSLSGNNSLNQSAGATGGVVLASNASAGVDAETLTVSQVISQSGGTRNFTKVGAGMLTLSANNTYNGTTTISAGAMQIGNGGTSGSLATSGVTNNASLIFNRSDALSVGYAIGGSGTVTKLGAGTTTFSANNTYTGVTTISQGTLALSTAGTNTISSSSNIIVGSGATLDVSAVSGGFAVASGQTLSGTGTVVGNMTVGTGSVLSPGNSPGTLAVTGNDTWAASGTYLWEINNATGVAGNATAGWDLETITGALNVTATVGTPFIIDIVGLNAGNAQGVVPSFNNATDYNWLIADAGSTITSFDPNKFSLTTGNFTNNNPLGGGSFAIVRGESVGGDDSQVYLTFTAVPEPSTLVLAAVGIAWLGYAVRRRRN